MSASLRERLMLGVVVGAGLAASRATILVAMDAHLPTERMLGRLGEALPGVVIGAIAIGLIGVFLRELARSTPVRAGGGVIVFASAFVLVSGWGLADPSRSPALASARGRLAVAAVFAVALGAAILISANARPVAALRRFLARPWVGVAAAVLLVSAPILVDRASRPDAVMPVRRIVAELLDDPARLEIVRGGVGPPIAPAVLCPSSDFKVEGGDRPALLMAPPAEVRFQVTPEDGRATLRLEAGVDRTVWHALDAGATLPVRFEVEVNGVVAFDEAIVVDRGSRDEGTPWVPVGGARGLGVAPGDHVVLRTSLPEGAASTRPVRAGFGSLRLERFRDVPRTRASEERPNVVLVVMDTLRADRASAYGYARRTTPRLDALAARGLLYEEAYATASYTWPSTASILTGLPPETHGVVSGASCWLSSSVDTVGEALQAAGWTTAAFSGNPLVVPGKNFDQGIERFDFGRFAFRKTDQFFSSIEEWLERHAPYRFFLHLQFVEPHAPYKPSAPMRAAFAADVPEGFSNNAIVVKSKRLRAGEPLEEVTTAEERAWIDAQYDAAVATGDQWLGRVLDGIDRLGLTGRTVVVFTSDHGEEVFEHGLATHGQSVHPELVRVPLVLAGPGIPAGVRCGTPVSNRHVAPTIARLAGAALPAVVDAMDLRAPDQVEPRPIVYSTHHGWWNGLVPTEIHGLRRGGWALQWAPTPDEHRLFDVRSDVGEHVDVAAEHPEVADKMLDLLRRLLDEHRARRRGAGFGADAETLELLQDIGYISDD